jgi:hypothetical protein
MFTALFLVSCAVEPEDLEAAALHDLDELSALVDAHSEAVRGSNSMMNAMEMEDAHHDEVTSLVGDLQHTMDEMLGCGMSSMTRDGMTSARHHVDAMWAEVNQHHDAHEDHVDMQDCWDSEDVYQPAMHDHMDDARSDMHGFADDADCRENHDGMGMM